MKKYIELKRDDREFLSKAFGITSRMVYSALHYESDSDLAKRVRKLAMSRGGVVMVEAPEVDTLFDADGYMRQRLENGVELLFDLKEGSCVVLHRGERVRRYDHVLVCDIRGIQDWASALR